MTQLNGQLYGPCTIAGQPFSGKGEERCCAIELVGHLLRIYTQHKPTSCLHTHPQDTVLEIMEKIGLSQEYVLVFNQNRLSNLRKTLLEYGIPDNRKIDLVVEPCVFNLDQLFG